MLARRRSWALEEGLDPDFVEKIYGRIVSHFVGLEMDRWQEEKAWSRIGLPGIAPDNGLQRGILHVTS